MSRCHRNAQHATSAESPRWGQPWWPEEDAVLQDTSLTHRQAALLINRTFKAVQKRRRKLAERTA